MIDMLPDVYFGDVDESEVDWRNLPDDIDSDDEELEHTPTDVIEMLGFDPKEFIPTTDAVIKYIPEGSHWITMHGAAGAKGHKVLIDKDGVIIAGGVPKELHGKKLD
jgi:hypothetical protein